MGGGQCGLDNILYFQNKAPLMARPKVERTGEWFPIKLLFKFRFLFTEKINPTRNSAYVIVSTMKRLVSISRKNSKTQFIPA
jgi:hypothetical protein